MLVLPTEEGHCLGQLKMFKRVVIHGNFHIKLKRGLKSNPKM
jgi:hypothetical protein